MKTLFLFTVSLVFGYVYTHSFGTGSKKPYPGSANEPVTRISDLKKYHPSVIEGKVTKILDEDEFRLQDESGKIKVYTGWKNTFVVSPGEKVKVKGHLDPGIIKEFYATEITGDNGKQILLNHD